MNEKRKKERKKKKNRPQFNIWLEATKKFGPALIGGALILVQLWPWSRFPHMTPDILCIQPIDYGVDAAG